MFYMFYFQALRSKILCFFLYFYRVVIRFFERFFLFWLFYQLILNFQYLLLFGINSYIASCLCVFGRFLLHTSARFTNLIFYHVGKVYTISSLQKNTFT